MSIRTRTATYVFIPMVTLVLLFVYAGTRYMDASFALLDEKDASKRVALTTSWLTSQAGYQERNAQSYGYWTDTWVFVKDRNRDYIRWSMTPTAFRSIDTDFMILLDTDARPVYAKFIHHRSARAEIIRFLRSAPGLTHLTESLASRRALTGSTAGPVALGLATIEPDTGLGPIRGTFVCGRFLDYPVEQSFAALVGLRQSEVAWWSLGQPGLPPAARSAAGQLASSTDSVAIRQSASDQTLGYGIIEGYEGKRVGVVQVTVDPTLADTHHRIVRAIWIGLLVFVVVGTATFLFALDISVMRRLWRLIRGVRDIGESEEKSEARVPVEGKDEIAELAVSVNGMLEAIDQQQEVLRQLATLDPLTNTFNRRRFAEEFDRELERSKRLGSRGALLSLDLDHFKEINDTYGHAAGDQVLSGVASLLRGEMRTYSTLARIGGDEFVMLLPGADYEEGVRAADRLLRSLAAAEIQVDCATVKVQISIGVAFYPDDGDTAEAVLKAADAAMYKSKRDGRGRASVAPGTAIKDEPSDAGR